MEWQPLVIVEGVTCTRAASVGKIGYSIWVDISADESLRRGIARDGEEHRELWLEWTREEKAFFAADQTRSRASFVFLGE